mgnify:CR=1 FL=1
MPYFQVYFNERLTYEYDSVSKSMRELNPWQFLSLGLFLSSTIIVKGQIQPDNLVSLSLAKLWLHLRSK